MYLRQYLKERADAVNLPNLGHEENYWWPAIQANEATAELNESRKCSLLVPKLLLIC